MSVAAVRQFLRERAPELKVVELEQSTATVAEAAAAHGVEPGQIAKTLSMHTPQGVVLVVARGDARLDNRKLKQTFGGRTKMLARDEVEPLTGHPVGGVCPFAVRPGVPIFCDVSLRSFVEVLPAAGSTTSAVRIAPARLAQVAAADWVDVCKS